MDRKQEMIRIINDMSGKYSGYEIYSDWLRCLALSISNACCMVHDKVWKDREQAYLDTMRKYTPEDHEAMARLTACLIDTLEDGPDDVLGHVYMASGMGSKIAGQFFTPYHLAVLTAKIGLVEKLEQYQETGKITINEPTCGGGAMIIASAQILRDQGINYQKAMEVVAQDLDWKGVYMCYVQLSLLGISAICVQGDTLQEPFIPGRTPRDRILVTPMKAGALI